jgi:uncharacterized membrane protein YkvI
MLGLFLLSEEVKNIIKIACIYATTIIGAGFASGQEIMQFFSAYRAGGFYGILLAGLLFSVIGCIVLESVYRERIRNYEEFLFPTFGWVCGWILEIIVTVFMLCLFCIMIAGMGNIVSEKIGIPFRYSVLIMGTICMVAIMTNIKGIAALSTVVTPVLVAGIILAGICLILFGARETFGISGLLSSFCNSWFFSSLLYVSYNSILAVTVMCSLFPFIKTVRTARLGGILGGAILCAVALIINIALNIFYPAAIDKELPIMSILKNFNASAGNLYAIVLWLAMFTSAVTAGFSFTERLGSTIKIGKRVITTVLCAAVIPLSTLGFSRLIAVIYPVFGYLGLFMNFVILTQGLLLIGKRSNRRYGGK